MVTVIVIIDPFRGTRVSSVLDRWKYPLRSTHDYPTIVVRLADDFHTINMQWAYDESTNISVFLLLDNDKKWNIVGVEGFWVDNVGAGTTFFNPDQDGTVSDRPSVPQ